MSTQLEFRIEGQPDPTSCGPTCLHAIYRYYGRDRALDEVVREVPALEGGGTLGVLLGRHALQQGFRVTIYTFNLTVLDPTWFVTGATDLDAKLAAQAQRKSDPKLRVAINGYRAFLASGGRLRMQDLTVGLLRGYLKRGIPLLAGLSSTYLYQSARERPQDGEDDDVAGVPAGHFVVLCGYDPDTRRIAVADPYRPNPYSTGLRYEVPIERAVCAILLGIVTYDANLIIVEPAGRAPRTGSRYAQDRGG
jgi:hypothetical protein